MVPNDGAITLSGSLRQWVSGAVLGAWLRGRLKLLLKPRGRGEGVRTSAARCQYGTAVSYISFTSQSPPAPRGLVPRNVTTFSDIHGVVFCVQIYLFAVFHKVIYFQHLFSLDLLEMWSYLSLAQVIHFNRCFLD